MSYVISAPETLDLRGFYTENPVFRVFYRFSDGSNRLILNRFFQASQRLNSHRTTTMPTATWPRSAAGDASASTAAATATVEVNSAAVKAINNGQVAKFKFPLQ
ncbi:hypothetical protein [Massilia antarctica]|uniref:hypothetical protein n=1 Tax=Massilia antarctica TaxID=2765360 RepID=UPI0011AF3C2E|nr:hypothetical protein [Massilia sp. H27-R4]MCY0911387.1 hypothetical protein [Massilia sp. H27-R4]